MTVLAYKRVKTRKEHHCFGCGRKFEAGSTLTMNKSVDDGEFSQTYWCQTCQTYWDKHMENGDEISFGELRSEDIEGWEKIRCSVEIE